MNYVNITSINSVWVRFGCVKFISVTLSIFLFSVVLCLQSADNQFAQLKSEPESNPNFGFRPYFRAQINGFVEPFAERKTDLESEVTHSLTE